MDKCAILRTPPLLNIRIVFYYIHTYTRKFKLNIMSFFNHNKPKVSAKDFFLYLAQAVALYVSAGSLITLLFGIINFLVVDPAAGSFAYGGYSGGMRFAIASLVIIFPLYLFLAWYSRKGIVKEPEKAELWVRTWFVYITLFIAGVIVIGDLVAVLNSFLGGELTLRFALKVLTLLIVAGAVFGYYFYDLRRSKSDTKIVRTSLVWISAVVVLAALVGGFVVMGSPFAQRDYRLDETRVNDLSQIQWEIVNYWQNKDELPDELSMLEDSLRAFRVPTDPITGAPYEYTKTGELSFELCAVFARGSRDDGIGRGPFPDRLGSSDTFLGGENNWEHDAGRQCFERTIDPDFFPARDR